MAEDPQARVTLHGFGEPLRRGVAAAVVHVEHLEIARVRCDALQRGVDFGEQRQDVLLLVAHRDDDR